MVPYVAKLTLRTVLRACGCWARLICHLYVDFSRWFTWRCKCPRKGAVSSFYCKNKLKTAKTVRADLSLKNDKIAHPFFLLNHQFLWIPSTRLPKFQDDTVMELRACGYWARLIFLFIKPICRVSFCVCLAVELINCSSEWVVMDSSNVCVGLIFNYWKVFSMSCWALLRCMLE